MRQSAGPANSIPDAIPILELFDDARDAARMAKSDPGASLADAAFKLLARKSWRELTLAGTAKAAKVPLADLLSIAPSKPALVALMLRRVGRETAARYRVDGNAQSQRDRIFDVALNWFECLGNRKAATRALYDGLKHDPFAMVALRSEILAAAEWLLALAEADSGLAMPLKSAALAGILFRAVPVWLEDGKDLTKTMARLDADLRRSGQFFRFWDFPDSGGR